MAIDVIDIARFEDGKMVEHWGVPDRLGGMMQLGLVPGPPPPARVKRRYDGVCRTTGQSRHLEKDGRRGGGTTDILRRPERRPGAGHPQPLPLGDPARSHDLLRSQDE